MPRFFIRSTLFNILFYVLTGISCIFLLPTLFLPRNIFMGVVHGYVRAATFLEKYVLGLTYEVRGREHLPTDGKSYIIAAKHQSAYETLKLHILFGDPAIVLKKELLKIPLWGQYLAKSDVIAIDRSSPKIAIKSIQDGARHVMSQNRPIIIFPQGTRVSTETSAKEKPYKIGIVRIQEATNLPIIPMALNTGIFQPRNAWCKKPGRVVFEFLPPILPNADNNPTDILHQLEMQTEEKTSQLMEEGLRSIKKKPKTFMLLGAALVILCAAYTGYWFLAANLVKNAILDTLSQISQNPDIEEALTVDPVITGFPFKIHVFLPPYTIKTRSAALLSIDTITAESLPILGFPIDITTGKINVSMLHWNEGLAFDSLTAQVKYHADVITIISSELTKDTTAAMVSGTIGFDTPPYPVITLDLDLKNHQPFLNEMVQKNIVKKKPAMFASVALNAMQQNGIVHTTFTSYQNKVYLGPIALFELSPIR